MNLVTGANGFLGAHVVLSLLQKGRNVKAFVRSEKAKEQMADIFRFYVENPQEYLNRIEWAYGDILDVLSLQEAFEGVENVYHCAAKVSFNKSDWPVMEKVNIEGTANVVNVSLLSGIKKLCHVSSIAALGRVASGVHNNEDTVWEESKLNSCYSKTKYASEMEVWRGIAEGLNAVIVNPSVILGPGDWNTGSCALFKLMDNGLKFYTKGINGYVDVRDVAESMVELTDSNISAQRFVVSAENLDYQTLFNAMAAKMSKPAPAVEVGPFLSGIAWRVMAVKSIITGKPATITRETARTAQKKYFYSSDKLIKSLNFRFRTMDETIGFACEKYKLS